MDMDREMLIIGYFEHTLTAAQQAEFDRLLVEDRDFADEVTFRREVRLALAHRERPQAKALLQRHEQRRQQPERTTRLRLRIAAAATVAAVVGLAIWLSIRQEPAEALYAAYYQPYPNTVMPIVRGGHDESLQQEAFRAYDQADFAKADTLFEQLFRETNAHHALLYRGVCLLESGRYRAAISVLAQYPREEPLGTYATWYRALAHLKLNEREQAIPLLQQVANGADSLSVPVRELLDDLR